MAYGTPIFGDDNANTFNGTYASEIYYGMGGIDTIFGGWGNDILGGGLGNDKIDGGEGRDSLSGDEGDDTLQGGNGHDTLMGGIGKDKLFGGNGDDTFFNFDVADLRGDTIDGGAGVDLLSADFTDLTAGIRFVAQDPRLTTSLGVIFTATGIERYQITGTDFADQITGYLLTDFLYGGLGNDTLRGLDGFDFLSGDEGADFLYGGNDSDFLSGDAGNDYLSGDAGGDTVAGGEGADRLLGLDGDDNLASGETSDDGTGDLGTEVDNLAGGNGNDRIEMGVKDVANAGAGVDHLQLDFGASKVGENFVFSTANIVFASGGSAAGFDTLEFFGGSVRDVVTGGARGDSLHGGGGNDLLSGGEGSDTLDGDAGIDTVNGGGGTDVLIDSAGADTLKGDAGNDTFQVHDSHLDKDVFDGGLDRDTVEFSSEGDLGGFLDLADQTKNAGQLLGDTFTNMEQFVGSDHDDVMLGGAAADDFVGGDSDDILDGRAGNDLLSGGDGSDTFTGGTGRDVFDLSAQALHGLWFGDVVTDFKQGDDKIRLSLEELGFADAAAVKFVSNASGNAANVAGPQLVYDQATDRLFIDQDGTGAEHNPLLIATFENGTNLAVTDFVFG